MVAFPGATPVTSPALVTDATAGLLELNVGATGTKGCPYWSRPVSEMLALDPTSSAAGEMLA